MDYDVTTLQPIYRPAGATEGVAGSDAIGHSHICFTSAPRHAGMVRGVILWAQWLELLTVRYVAILSDLDDRVLWVYKNVGLSWM